MEGEGREGKGRDTKGRTCVRARTPTMNVIVMYGKQALIKIKILIPQGPERLRF